MGRKVCKAMINYIKKEPLFKKMLIILLLNSFFVCAVFISTQYYFLEQIHREQIRLNQNLVGKLVNIYPEKELDIVKTVIDKNSDEITDVGNKTLLKYGYDISTKAFEDDIFKAYFYKFMISTTLIFIIIMVINILLFMYGSRYFTERLEAFSRSIDKVIDGDFSVNIFADKEGILSRIYVQFEQMTRRLENTLNSLEKEKENIKSLITDISHQLKTPLASIKMFNSLLLDEDLSNIERMEFLYRSKEDINKLQWLTDSLVKLSRLEAGMISLKKEKGDINETIFESVNQVYLKASEKNIDISVDCIESCFITHDLKWTKEAIFNVIENAIKYTKENGHIKISINKMESYLRIDIEDNGIGIPNKETNNIFKRFYRGTSKTVQESEGSGVGLYLTRKILEQQGGCITVKSELGKGTVFSLFLQNC